MSIESVPAKIKSFCRRRLHRQQIDADLDEEIRSTLELLAERKVSEGMDPDSARRAAKIEMGGVEQVKEEVRAVAAGVWLDSLLQDVRFGLRMLRKSPSFAVTAVVTLAVAIGANSVAFGAFNAIVLRPLDVPQPQNLYELERKSDKYSADSYPNYLDLRDRNRSFEDLAAFALTQPGFETGENPIRVWGYEVSGNYFDVLGTRPYLGRLIEPSDEQGDRSAPYIVLTYGFWHSQFQAKRDVIGRTVRLNKKPFTVIGVTPPGFNGTMVIFSPSFFIPVVNEESSLLHIRGNRWVEGMFGHLKDGVKPAQATADLNSVASYLQKTYPKDDDKLGYLLARPSLGGDFLGSGITAFLGGLMLLAGLILLAACANLGNLFAARAADRSREVALRLALGASRLRILRQLFTEAILISVIGGALGLWGSVVLLQSLSAWRPFSQYPFNIGVSPDANVYLVAVFFALGSGFLFGAAPIRQVLRTDSYQVVKSGSPTRTGRSISARDFLLAAQIAICAILVTSSFVAVRGLARSLGSNFGFEPRNMMLAETDLSMAGYSGGKIPAMQKRMLDSVQTIPGVTSAAWVGLYPPLHMGWDDQPVFSDTAADLRTSNALAEAITYRISPQYFQAVQTHLLSGREFTTYDDQTAPRVAVINQRFARNIFGSLGDAIGHYFKLKDGTRIEVVGVVEDGKYTANLAENPQSAMFLPILQFPASDAWLLLRSSGDPQELSVAVKNKLRDLDSGVPVFIQTWNEEMNGALFAPRMATASLGILGIMGAMLSVTGIFGMTAYAVSKRKRDLGIRMALGAQRREVLQAALGRALKTLAVGSGLGLLAGIFASRLLASIVYEASPRDPLVLTAVVLAMVLIGIVATWVPANRALSIDPATLLREE